MRMPPIKKLFIDEDGVERGYYVYAHKNSHTNVVFYVGMGHGRRAWDKTRRPQAWQETITAIRDAWTVEILKDNLSELEAFQLEHEKVIEYGGPARSGGKLTNIVPGGQDPLAGTLCAQIPEFGWSEAYHAARRFRVISRLEQEQLVKDCLAQIDSTETALDDLDYEASENQNDSLADSAWTIGNIVRNLTRDGEHFLRRKISWKDLCMGIENAHDELATEMRNVNTHHARVRPLLELAASKITALFASVDSGNRDDAEAYAAKIAKENANVFGNQTKDIR
jgi:hypothetical protein